jgi:DNA-binding HxlR family transcriptional regulator
LEEKCSLNELLDLVSKRWFSDVLFCIQEGNNRFKLIKDDLKFISDTILSDRLKLLERYSLISRMDFDEIPPKVEYSLTDKGEELVELLEKMCEFSDILMAENAAAKGAETALARGADAALARGAESTVARGAGTLARGAETAVARR